MWKNKAMDPTNKEAGVNVSVDIGNYTFYEILQEEYK